jgi:hypothetical protein
MGPDKACVASRRFIFLADLCKPKDLANHPEVCPMFIGRQ